jgi:hypothetical protein
MMIASRAVGGLRRLRAVVAVVVIPCRAGQRVGLFTQPVAFSWLSTGWLGILTPLDARQPKLVVYLDCMSKMAVFSTFYDFLRRVECPINSDQT